MHAADGVPYQPLLAPAPMQMLPTIGPSSFSVLFILIIYNPYISALLFRQELLPTHKTIFLAMFTSPPSLADEKKRARCLATAERRRQQTGPPVKAAAEAAPADSARARAAGRGQAGRFGNWSRRRGSMAGRGGASPLSEIVAKAKAVALATRFAKAAPAAKAAPVAEAAPVAGTDAESTAATRKWRPDWILASKKRPAAAGDAHARTSLRLAGLREARERKFSKTAAECLSPDADASPFESIVDAAGPSNVPDSAGSDALVLASAAPESPSDALVLAALLHVPPAAPCDALDAVDGAVDSPSSGRHALVSYRADAATRNLCAAALSMLSDDEVSDASPMTPVRQTTAPVTPAADGAAYESSLGIV